MNDKPQNSPRLSDDQMDHLLSAFYKMEVPAELDTLPSSWPQIRDAATTPLSTAGVTMTALPKTRQSSTTAPSSRRVVAVAATALAACLLLFVTTRSSVDSESSPNSTVEVQPGNGVTGSEFMNVSGNGEANGGVVDENGTTLDEMEGVDLSPGKGESKKDKAETGK